MNKKRKIILIGPPGTEKTTIKKVFFEKGNPFKLLKTSLKPTKGINSSVHSFFDINLGVFDLAGQENENWFTSDRMIFSGVDMIICVLDVNVYLGDNLDFMNKVIGLYKEMKLFSCIIIVLMHKIDLIDKLYLQYKLKAFEEFVKKKDIDLKTYSTSIANDHFFDTFDSISEILTKIIGPVYLKKTKSVIQEFRDDLKIILQFDELKRYNVYDITDNLQMSVEQASYHLERLENLGFVEYLDNIKNFQLTDKSSFFKAGVEGKQINEDENKINRILENLYFFSNLKNEED